MKRIINNKGPLLKLCQGILAVTFLVLSLLGEVPAPLGALFLLNGCAPAPYVGSGGGFTAVDNHHIDLFNAIHQKNNDYVFRSINSQNVNALRFVNNLTPLVWAIQAKNIEAAKYIINIGADVNLAQNQNQHFAVNNSTVKQITTPLMAASAHTVSDPSTWLPVVKLLIGKGADVNSKQYTYVNDPGNNTNLEAEFYPICSYSANDEILKLLVDRGANVNAQCSSKNREVNHIYTALHTAVAAGNLQSIKLLISHGADISIRDGKGKTALQIAEEKRDFAAVEIIKSGRSGSSNIASNKNPQPEKKGEGGDANIVLNKKSQSEKKGTVITIISPEVQSGLVHVAKEASLRVTGTVDSVSKVVKVTVNGRAASLDKKGNFSADVKLKPGENKVIVTAFGMKRQLAAESFTVDRKDVQAIAAVVQAPTDVDSSKCKKEQKVNPYYLMLHRNLLTQDTADMGDDKCISVIQLRKYNDRYIKQ